jgi:hypothetical protein
MMGVPEIGMMEIRRCLAFETRGIRDQRAAKIGRWNRVPRDQEIGGRAGMPVIRKGSLRAARAHDQIDRDARDRALSWIFKDGDDHQARSTVDVA